MRTCQPAEYWLDPTDEAMTGLALEAPMIALADTRQIAPPITLRGPRESMRRPGFSEAAHHYLVARVRAQGFEP